MEKNGKDRAREFWYGFGSASLSAATGAMMAIWPVPPGDSRAEVAGACLAGAGIVATVCFALVAAGRKSLPEMYLVEGEKRPKPRSHRPFWFGFLTAVALEAIAALIWAAPVLLGWSRWGMALFLLAAGIVAFVWMACVLGAREERRGRYPRTDSLGDQWD